MTILRDFEKRSSKAILRESLHHKSLFVKQGGGMKLFKMKKIGI